MKKLIVLAALFATASFAADVKHVAVAGTDVDIASGAVHGTLLAPKSATPIPVVLLIAGSGPTDRNGNSAMLGGANDSLRLVADGLAANGIASLRYDKRGIGASMKVAEAELRFDTYVEDAAVWCGMLKKDPRFSRVIIAGHSEGSLIGMIAAKRCGAAGFISLEGAGQSAGKLLRTQLAGKLPPELAQKNEAILESLEAGKQVADVPQPLFVLYRPSVQPYMISWLKYDPAGAIAQLTVPVLIVQGTTDVQVGVADATRLAASNPKAKLVTIEGMNHVLKVVTDPQKQAASYVDPTLPLAPELIPAMVELVNEASHATVPSK